MYKIDGTCDQRSDDYFYILLSQNGFTPLYVASQKGHSQVAELLLSKGADVNLLDQVQYYMST